MCPTPIRNIAHECNTRRYTILYFWETSTALVHNKVIPSQNPERFLAMICDCIVSLRGMQAVWDQEYYPWS